MRLKAWLEDLFLGLNVFVSSHRADIPLGKDWMKTIQTALDNAMAYLVLVSDRSNSRNWVWLETGVAWATGRDIVPMCLPPQHKASIARPWSDFQGVNLYEEADLSDLVERVSGLLGVTVPTGLSVSDLAQELSEKNEMIGDLNQDTSTPLAETPRFMLTTRLATIGTGVVVHPLVLRNAAAEAVQIVIRRFEIRESDVDIPGSPDVLIDNLQARWVGKVLNIGPSDELTIDDDVSPKTAANLVIHFSFDDKQGNPHEDAVQGV